MFSTLRTRFGVPGVISVIALVFAMFGGAYAASNSSDSGKATASAKAKKGPRGPKGATGPAGPQGPVGPVGPAGAKGDPGEEGEKGKEGKTGATGKNGVDGAPGATGPTGPPGPVGPEGVCSTSNCHLPSGVTETGTWSADGVTSLGYASISFAIPLSAPIGGANVHYLDEAGQEEGAPSTKCLGTAAAPKAEPGNLCIYTGTRANVTTSNEFIVQASSNSDLGASTSGSILALLSTSNEFAGFGYGTWAVTAP